MKGPGFGQVSSVLPWFACFAAASALEGSPPRSAAAVRAAQVDGPDKLLGRFVSLPRVTLVPRSGF